MAIFQYLMFKTDIYVHVTPAFALDSTDMNDVWLPNDTRASYGMVNKPH